MEWSIEPRLMLALATGALVLVAAGLLFVGWRKRKASSGSSQLENIVSSYPGLDPGMARVLKSLLQTGLVDELARQTDVQQALHRLNNRYGGQQKKLTPGSVLSVRVEEEPSENRKIDPALFTILRVAYFSPQITDRLSTETIQELDQLLDSLTG